MIGDDLKSGHPFDYVLYKVDPLVVTNFQQEVKEFMLDTVHCVVVFTE